ncbi:unnamed protein product [Clavelina lepadiformis]|uniref:Translin-associated factor X-interacting protein 1 N-terminal domain-containing protein n=1 Tax=Clavelina lepadiformis TaxID=159417 RepID=A0ABP0G7L3_CLALP
MKAAKLEFKKDPGDIHSLLESTLEAHRKDIYDYAAGHLNSNKLAKPPATNKQPNTAGTSNFWASSVIKERKPRQKSLYDEDKINEMSNALFDFSFGTTAFISNLKSDQRSSLSSESSRAGTPLALPTLSLSELQLQRKLLSQLAIVESARFASSKSSLSITSPKPPSSPSESKKNFLQRKTHASNVYVEELKLPELMLPSVNSLVGIPPSLQQDEKYGTSRRVHERRKFVTTHHAGVTRKDQFQKMLDFDRTILKKHETLEHNLRDGHKAVEHLEHKLVQRLLDLQLKELPLGPSFERLQLYSEIWSDLTIDSSILGSLLGEIKEEYDSYLTFLLDSMKSSNRVELASCLKEAEDVSNDEKLRIAEEVCNEVDTLETLCKEALLRNSKLQEEITADKERIEEERKLQKLEDEENIRRMMPLRRVRLKTASFSTIPLCLTTEKRLKYLRAEILRKLDEVNEEKFKLKNCYVPKPTHRNLQHAVKDLEIELQKLQRQNDFLEQNQQDFSVELADSLRRCRVDDEAMRVIWKIVEGQDNEPAKS